MYNRSIYKVTIYLLFAIMFVAESKNVYQWRNVYQCVYFRVLFVVFLVETIAQLTFLLGLDYLPTAQAVRVLDFTVVFSSTINLVRYIVGAIASDLSFLGISPFLLIAVDMGITFGLMAIYLPYPNIALGVTLGGPPIIVEVAILLYACLSKKKDDSWRALLTFKVAPIVGGFALCLVPFIVSTCLYHPETLAQQQLLMIVPLAYCALKALGAGSLWIFGIFARSNNGEEERKKLLGDASLSSFRTF
jgi:hypothetical protein